MGNFQEVFLIILSLWVLFIHETFLVYKLETFRNWKEVKHIMIKIIDFDFLSYVIFDEKNPLPPLKIQKVQVPQFLLTLKIFQPFLQKVGRPLCNISYQRK